MGSFSHIIKSHEKRAGPFFKIFVGRVLKVISPVCCCWAKVSIHSHMLCVVHESVAVQYRKLPGQRRPALITALLHPAK